MYEHIHNWRRDFAFSRQTRRGIALGVMVMLASACDAKPDPALAATATAKPQVPNSPSLRRVYAGGLEEKFLDLGLDVRVTAVGESAEVLRLRYIFAGRVFAHQIDESDVIASAMQLGFARVEIYNNDGLTASWTLR